MAGSRDRGLDGAVPFRFACSRCGHCCSGGEGYAWVDASEIEPLARALGMEAAAFVDLHVREASDPRDGSRRLALRERADGRCTLLEGRNTCRAYDARPAHCRDFPYWPSVMQGGAGFEAARATCPGIAVVPDPALAADAFARLEALYAEIEYEALAKRRVHSPRSGCCLEGGSSEDLYMSALEADYAAGRGGPPGGCRLGEARPIGCRVAGLSAGTGEDARARLRTIERDTGYPAAYGEARALLRARGLEVEGRA